MELDIMEFVVTCNVVLAVDVDYLSVDWSETCSQNTQLQLKLSLAATSTSCCRNYLLRPQYPLMAAIVYFGCNILIQP